MRSSFFTKMILFNFILTTIPVIAIGIFSYVKSSDEIQNQVNRGKMQLLKQMNTNIEQVLKTVNHTLDQFVTSTVTRKALDNPLTAYDFILYNDLRSELSHLQLYDTKVNEVALVNVNQNWLVKNSGIYKLSEYSERKALTAHLQSPENTTWVFHSSKLFNAEDNANNPECPYTISLVKKLPANDPNKYGLVFANIPTCSLVHFLNYNANETEKVMVLDDQFRILLYPEASMIGKSVLNTGFIDNTQVFSQPSGQFNVNTEDTRYTISYLHSSYNGWTYVSIISIDSLTRESKKIGMYTLYMCLVIFLISIITAWLGSKRMYTPIQKLLLQISDRLPDLNLQKRNEFQVIGEQVQHLFASKSRLEHEMHLHLQQIRTHFLIKWLQESAKQKELVEKLNSFGYHNQLMEWRTMAVITLQIDSLENTRYEKQDIELLLFAMNNIVEEIVPAAERLNPVMIDQTQATVIGSASNSIDEFNAAVYALTESIQQKIRSYLNLQISIGISLPFNELNHAPLAYREGLDALRQRIKLGEGVIIQYDSMNSGKHYMYVDYPVQKETELIEAIKLADPEAAKLMLSRFMAAVFKLELSPQEYQIPLVRLLNNLMKVMQEAGISLKQINKANSPLYEDLLSLHKAADIEQWFYANMALPLIEVFRDRQDSQYHNISEKIIAMIQKYYDTDLTIEKCAADLHYNANYISSVFRKENNLSFSEYLTAYRFNMAKKWLSETDMTVKEIAEKLRYNNSQNFIRSFRKVEGMTPGQFREKL